MKTPGPQPLHGWRKRERRSRSWLALVLSLGLHALLLSLLVFASLLHLTLPGEPPLKRQAVSLRPMTDQQWVRNRGARADDSHSPPSPSRRAEKSKAADKKQEPVPKGQVVDVAPGNNEEAPDAKYLAESANKVKKESRSKTTTPFYRNAMPRPTSTVASEGTGADAAAKKQTAGNNGMGNDDRPLNEPGPQKRMLEIPTTQPRQEVALRAEKNGAGPGPTISNQSESDAVKGNSNRLKIQPGAEGGSAESAEGRQGDPGVTNLVPSLSVVDKISGAPANDHLDVDEGEGTYLNTKEWKFSSFFNRVKQSVGMNWDPGTLLRQRDQTGNIYGGRDRYTVLNVTLNERGLVKDIFVEKSSGLDFLDLEAINAFQKAQPFPNPPPGLLADDSTVRFTFGFFLELGNNSRVRLFRQAN